MQKILVFLLAVAVQIIFVWYSHKTGRTPDAGTFLGFKYDSRIISSIIMSLKYVVILTIANAIVTFTAKTGIEAFNTFLPYILIWIAAAPVAALTFNWIVGKETINMPIIAGLLFVVLGSVLISANKEILDLLQK